MENGLETTAESLLSFSNQYFKIKPVCFTHCTLPSAYQTELCILTACIYKISVYLLKILTKMQSLENYLENTDVVFIPFPVSAV